jgi:uncharacterized protein YbjT (DUF2867 family)
MSKAIATVLVTAGNGNQARSAIPRLVKAGYRVRAMRNSDRPGPGPKELGAQEVVVGDATNPDQAYKAMDGVQAVYHVGPTFHPLEREMGFNMIEQAKRAGVEHFVFSSVLHPILYGLPQHAIKRSIEEHLLESRLNFTILHDVAEVLVKVLREGPVHYGATYELTCEDNPSKAELVESLSKAFGRPFTLQKYKASFEHRPEIFGHVDAAHARHQMETLKAVHNWYNEHDFIGNGNVLRMLLGRKPTSFVEFVRKHYGLKA